HRRGLLGLGVVETLEPLAEEVAGRLLRGMGSGGAARGPRGDGAAVVALVPLSSLSETDATRAAETVTEAVRAALQEAGVRVLSPNRVADALRGARVFAWGALDAAVRRPLAEAGADLLLTGSVEAWDARGDGLEPEPVVAVALRAVDARTGRIVWTGALDRRGWDRQGLFRLGRVHDHGSLAAGIAERLVAGLAAPGGVLAPSAVNTVLEPSGETTP
ncbi:MAG TPA: GNA1162 family protein, partial [Thermoanaerobaculia bacterium]|nr:GNA1162 family protein [Thermoanaerobaculia bacterium]